MDGPEDKEVDHGDKWMGQGDKEVDHGDKWMGQGDKRKGQGEGTNVQVQEMKAGDWRALG
jgi:hypothetical protein